jgi:hypothetical protein
MHTVTRKLSGICAFFMRRFNNTNCYLIAWQDEFEWVWVG